MLAVASAALLTSQQVPAGTCGDTEASTAGYFSTATEGTNYFYWQFASRNDPVNDPVFFWFTGGPGCASTLALLSENGPCKMDIEAGVPKYNPYSWTNNATGVWVDQPAGAGFSYSTTGNTDHNEAQVSADMVQFLQNFFRANPALQKNEVFIFGESYGGHYAPSIAYAVWKNNQDLPAGDVHINLSGVGVGNGLTDPSIQYQYYPEMAYNYSISKLGYPVVNLQTYQGMEAAVPTCVQLTNQCQTDTNQCPTAQSYCNDFLLGPYENTGLNPYDIRETCEYPPLCYDMTPMTNWYNEPSVQQALGIAAQNITWAPCNFVVNEGFSSDWSKDFQQLLPPMMASGIRVLIYAGDVDFVCNWLGNHAWTQALQWPGNAGFNAARASKWYLDGLAVGTIQHYETLTFTRVFNAGHMVPQDQPAAALDLVNKFMYNKLA